MNRVILDRPDREIREAVNAAVAELVPLLPQEREKDGLVVTIKDRTYYSVKAPNKTNCENCDIFKDKKPISMIDVPLCYSYSLNNHKIVDYCRSKRVIWKRAKRQEQRKPH